MVELVDDFWRALLDHGYSLSWYFCHPYDERRFLETKVLQYSWINNREGKFAISQQFSHWQGKRDLLVKTLLLRLFMLLLLFISFIIVDIYVIDMQASFTVLDPRDWSKLTT